MKNNAEEELLLDHPSLLLEGLTEEQRKEALAAAAAAKRAEERAEQRALERAMEKRAQERRRKLPLSAQPTTQIRTKTTSVNPNIVFVSKRKRQKTSSDHETTSNNHGQDAASAAAAAAASNNNTSASTTPLSAATATTHTKSKPKASFSVPVVAPVSTSVSTSSSWTYKERQAVRKTYLGNSALAAATTAPKPKEKKKKSTTARSKKATFRFEWDNTDDTTLDDRDPLYAALTVVSHHRKNNKSNSSKRAAAPKDDDKNNPAAGGFHNKPLYKMTARDWRIFRENYEIVVKGGRAPPPLRSFREANLHHSLLDAIENVMQYKQPTPIQRQAIPIGLQRRDLIGIAETGSGKTCAFGVPLLQYLLSLPSKALQRIAEDGPLALVMAPTRELALQIHGEFQKMLSRQSKLRISVIIGGQSIQHQAQQLREGVHVVVGTPGRMNDCIENAYLVLNQCCYIVLDEADRMIDMGFAPQMESILDAMGGLLKSENEKEAYKQEEEDLKSDLAMPRHRLTAMFSATMPLEVERIAKRYLRHPAVISIGDQDSGKNARIVQCIVYLSSASQKESALRKLVLNPRYLREKVIVFVNEKKHADGVGRMVERMGRACVVLHGGKSQEQREENLETFRQGGVVLVATDVAGRGLDIPNVAHIINFDLPSRSIDNYSHRIGRTGRAGKEGMATSLMTDEDEGIMAPLKAYLESTGNPVPEKLARHPAATASTQGNVIY